MTEVDGGLGPVAAEPTGGTEVRYHRSDSLPGLLEQIKASLLISTYQAGQLVGVGVAEGDLKLSFRHFDKAMGIALARDRLAVASKGQIWTLIDRSDVASRLGDGHFDRCWVPRSSTVTGPVQCHEVVWARGDVPDGSTTVPPAAELWFVNTSFSCLATLDERFAFVPRWRPPFISALAPEDRCHLNGLALRDGQPSFVTVMAPSDQAHGWRAERNDSGAVLDVATGEAVTTGLAMPHSPRIYRGHLFVLNSGRGLLEQVDLATGQRNTVAALPGYARGLAFYGGFAFVGLSKIRETAIFGGAPIAEFHDQLKCGVGVIELATGNTVATFEFLSGVEEIFDVQIAPGVRCPVFGGWPGEEDEVWVLPAQQG